ncbi:MAG: tetratricopeptide repeat protein [Candidatus Omnitrophica bacterium]|nr:tetratricopeptide repeat protein [Candidatus Omnitrophota bacterium]
MKTNLCGKTMAEKNIIFLFLCVIFIAGCSSEYQMERLVWQANKAAEIVFMTDGAVSPYEFDKAILFQEKIIKNAPESEYGLNARFAIAKLYVVKKSFDKAREVYDKILESFPEKHDICALALFSKGQVFELEGNWTQALIIFNEIISNYSKTRQGVIVPLYIARYYVKNKDQQAAAAAYNSARSYYKSVAKEYQRAKAGLLAENLIIRTFIEEGNWKSAVDYIEELDTKYKLGVDTLVILAQIYKNKLNDMEKALKILDRISKEFPDFKKIEQLKKEISSDKNQQ